MATVTGARLLVQCLEAQGVEYIFGIPGAKIDSVFNELVDSRIRLVVCRHEQNAVFIAAAYGRLTGKPGVVLVTSGPGIANMTTGLLTATTEGDPVVAIGGNVPRAMRLKQSHQSADNVKLMEAVTKYHVEVPLAGNIPEIVDNAFRSAMAPMSGAAFISVPQDVLSESCAAISVPVMPAPLYGPASMTAILDAATRMNQAKQPVLLLGMASSRPDNAKAIRELLQKQPFQVVSTYQAAGVIPQSLVECFIGRVGLFKNQPGDVALAHADLVVTIGFNPVEYDPEVWNADNSKTIIHIDVTPCDIHNTYHPVCEALGDIASTLTLLSEHIAKHPQGLTIDKKVHEVRQSLMDKIASGKQYQGSPIHPLRFIYELREAIDDDTTICCDIGSVYMWMARYFLSYSPHQLLFSNGQQTLGVGLPWAMACNYARPGRKVVSLSGDGGFLFSAMELETAVREGLHFVHFIWQDGSYNMVLEQELMKYHRKSGVDFNPVNIIDFANAFGAIGLELRDPNDFQALFKHAMQADKPVLINVPIDYSDNPSLFAAIDPESMV